MVPVRVVAPTPKVHFSFPPSDLEPPLELLSLGYNPDQEYVDRPKGCEAYHWLQSAGGLGEVSIGPRRSPLGPGQGILLPPNLPHAYAGRTPVWSTRYLTFRGPMAEILVSSFGLATSTRISWSAGSAFEGLLGTLTEPLCRGGWGNGWDRSTLVYRFLSALKSSGEAVDPCRLADLTDRLAPLFEHVEARLADPDLGVDAMARFLCVSPRHLNELFARAGQASPYQYLKNRRLDRARQLLLWYRDLGVKEISAQVGFRDPSHFIHAFRQSVGKSPEAFRRAMASH